MQLSQTISRAIKEKLRAKYELERKQHTPSGKLSAGRLGDPLQWQVLHTIGVPAKEADDYALQVFTRGDDVEEWLVKMIPGLIEKQMFLEYRNVVGYADTVIDTKDYDFKVGIVPNEIKSVKNSAYKYIVKENKPKIHHVYQAVLYGLAMGVDNVYLTYVASDDYRVLSFVLDVKDYKEEIDQIIDDYDQAMKLWKEKGLIPKFEPKQKWQANQKYNPYPKFMKLTSQEAGLKVKELLTL